MANNTTVLFPSGWSPRQYILAAMAGTLVASTVIIIASVILSPAQIHFSVTDARSHPLDGKGVVLNFTLAVDNPSRRAGVQYRDVNVDLMLYTASKRFEAIQASVVNVTTPFYQPPMNSTSMGASGFLAKGFLLQNFGASQYNGSASPMSVVVIAEVRFKVGVAYSRPYDVKVSCPSVHFFTDKNLSATSVNCF